MNIGEIRILSFLNNSKRKNDIDVDIAAGINMTVSEVKYFASKLEEYQLIVDVSNEYQKDMLVQAWALTSEGNSKLKKIESQPKKAKLEKIAKMDGTFIYRPLKQDIVPSAFEMNPVSMIASFEVPTERRMLWLISHYPYLLNSFFLNDLGSDRDGNFKITPKMEDALKVLHSIRLKHYIKQSEDNLTFSITLKGRLYRLTSHPQWILLQLLLTALLALVVGIIIKKRT